MAEYNLYQVILDPGSSREPCDSYLVAAPVKTMGSDEVVAQYISLDRNLPIFRPIICIRRIGNLVLTGISADALPSGLEILFLDDEGECYADSTLTARLNRLHSALKGRSAMARA